MLRNMSWEKHPGKAATCLCWNYRFVPERVQCSVFGVLFGILSVVFCSVFCSDQNATLFVFGIVFVFVLQLGSGLFSVGFWFVLGCLGAHRGSRCRIEGVIIRMLYSLLWLPCGFWFCFQANIVHGESTFAALSHQRPCLVNSWSTSFPPDELVYNMWYMAKQIEETKKQQRNQRRLGEAEQYLWENNKENK